MQKGLIFDIRRYSVHDGPGIRTTVFFKGCPLHCIWCHNPEGIGPELQTINRCRTVNGRTRNAKEQVGRWVEAEELMEELLRDRLFFEESGGGVTFSGGEPLAQPKFLKEMLVRCAAEGIHTAVDTSGHAPEAVFADVTPLANVLLFDLKSADPSQHLQHTGEDNTLILKNLLSVPEGGPRVYLRIPVIPGLNDQPEQMLAIRELLCGVRNRVVRVDLLPHHRLGRQKYEALGLAAPAWNGDVVSTEQTERCKKVFEQGGFEVKIGG